MEDPTENKFKGGILNLQKRMADALANGKLADVQLVVGQGANQKKFLAHRNILSFSSNVFMSLFFSSREGMEWEVFLADVDPDAFDKLLRYIYYEAIPSNLQDLMELYQLANKFQINDLKEQCVFHLGRKLKKFYPQSVCDIYDFAIKTGTASLKEQCALMVSISTETLLKSPSFLQCSEQVLKEIVGSKRLNVSSEAQLFQALLSWCQAKLKTKNGSQSSSLRSVMQPFLPLVRFRSMSLEEFANVSQKYADGVFTEEELEYIFKDIRGKDNFFCSIPWYNLCRRSFCQERFIELFPTKSLYSLSTDFVEHFAAVLKSESEDIVVTKLGFESLSFGHEMKLCVSVVDTNTEEITGTVSAYWDANVNGWMIGLPVPCVLRKGVSYEFSLRKSNNRGFKGTFRDIKKNEWNMSYSHKKGLRITKISKYMFDYIVAIVM